MMDLFPIGFVPADCDDCLVSEFGIPGVTSASPPGFDQRKSAFFVFFFFFGFFFPRPRVREMKGVDGRR